MLNATEYWEPDAIGNMFRTLGSVLNSAVYTLLSAMYQIFFNVSSAQLFENETIKNFYGRVQLIIGVFMVFKLAITILQGIMNPDKFTNNKDGFGTIITRVIISLIMLAVIVPINVPDVQNANSYEKYINNNGLLFGTLYSLQDRILSGNTLGRLILGTTDSSEDSSNSNSNQSGMTQAQIQQQKLAQSANIFSSTILKGFLRPNMLPDDQREDDNDNNTNNWYCGQKLDDPDVASAYNVYNQLDVSPDVLLSSPIVLAKCRTSGGFFGNKKFLFYFNFVISVIIGAVFLVILALFTIDIAVRSIKLAILRLLAPIPIISYIEPKSAKDGMFASWVKSLTSTYLDLFLRLAIVYFVIFIIQDMMVNGVVIDQAGGMVGIISVIFIWLGLFYFARMAPKFIKDVLGIKGTGMSNIGLSGALAAAGAIRQGGTALDAVFAAGDATDAQIQAYNQGKAAPGLGMAFNSGRDLAAQMMTGDERMNHRKMTRGRWQLREMGITPQAAKRVHDAAIQAQAFTERMSSDAVAGKATWVDDRGRTHHYKWRDDQGNLHNVSVDNQGYANKEEMSLALAQQRALSGKLASRDKKIDREMQRTGQARGYRDSVRIPNDNDTGMINQYITDRYLSRRHEESYNPATGKYGEKGPDTYQPYQATDPNDYRGNATGYDVKTHNE